MTPVEQPQPVSDRTGRTSPDRRRTFGLIATVLAAVVGVTLAAASHNNKWWSDNLMGLTAELRACRSNQEDECRLLEVAWFYPYATQVQPDRGRQRDVRAGLRELSHRLDATTGKEL
jgi:hypothetical protein